MQSISIADKGDAMSGAKKGEDFSNFKIGAMPGFGPGGGLRPSAAPTQPVAAPIATPSPTTAQEETPSETRFPNLEALLECENSEIQAFAESMGAICEQLDELIAKRSGRIKQEAQNARAAYEQTFSLIDYLLEVKAQILNPEES